LDIPQDAGLDTPQDAGLDTLHDTTQDAHDKTHDLVAPPPRWDHASPYDQGSNMDGGDAALDLLLSELGLPFDMKPDPPLPKPKVNDDDGGCAMTPSSPPGSLFILILLGGMVFFRRRRRA